MNLMSGRPEFYEEITGSRTMSSSDDVFSGGGGTAAAAAAIAKEHMFDKVVTPSDVGKLNRLVIPKQHAEKYFPLDSSTNEKGLVLDFEDRNGKPWRFRYSYWNSSQSYVMTKGWSRFVKDKKLDAGDTVSFHRAPGKDKFFIDWRRRFDTPTVPALTQLSFHSPLFLQPSYSHLLKTNQYRGGYHPYYGYNGGVVHGNPCPPGSVVYARPAVQGAGGGGLSTSAQIVLDAVPVVQGKAAASGKRLRLFGVNMDCPINSDDESHLIPPLRFDSSSSSSAPSDLQLRPYNSGTYKGKGSMSLDLDI
ncbi:hypothetical protein BUALT_Bualt05G0092400 [Buddleja alternifolia]|uniref:TF-B3 domain-containing protein n=1 Tax=Buddleja alternifolia TaxID=168488 RepID=A0AAV6XM70_9LAMI|nr:hypothetical protein BUALT_Bualt05G0092400 [Buddleja alternifolia]